MSYFAFSEILIGILSFILSGCFTAFLTESVKLLLSVKNEFPKLVCHLYKDRNAFFGRKMIFIKRKSNRFDAAITEFLSVILLFIAYIAVSYLCFDGIFRFIYFLLLLISYFLFEKYLLKPYAYILEHFTRFLLNAISLILSPWIFLLCKLLFVLKLPIAGIISTVRSLVLIILSKKRAQCMMKKVTSACKKMIEAAM